MKRFFYNIFYIIILTGIICLCFYFEIKNKKDLTPVVTSYDILNIPEYSGEDYVIINNNNPDFDSKYMNTESFEEYYDLDELGRCTGAFANLSKDLMPTEKRGNISHIKPSGWKISKYDFIDGLYLYNRCHLIAYSLSGENDNINNLITCTRHLNAFVMEDFEEKVRNYIYKTSNHVLYRVTPMFTGENLLADGVHMEAYSVEDNGKGIKFNIFAYNIEPGININYLNSDNSLVQ